MSQLDIGEFNMNGIIVGIDIAEEVVAFIFSDEGVTAAVYLKVATITATVGGKQVTCEVTVADAVPEGFTVTTYEALLEALRMGGASADVPTLIMLGSDITIPAGGDRTNPPINGSGYRKLRCPGRH